MCTNIFLTSRCNVLQDMTVKDTKKEHHNKREAEAVISVAQITAIVRVRNVIVTKWKKYLITEKRECWREGGEVTGSSTGYSMCFASCY